MTNLGIVAKVMLTVALAAAAAAQAQVSVHSCNPWPRCQFDDLVIKPGAPSTGLRPQGRPRSELRQQELDRGSLKLPAGGASK